MVPKATPNAYSLLGVERGATPAAIRRGYREQMRQWHPDLNHAPEAETRAKAINWAYDILSSRTRRAEYDQQLAAQPLGAESSYPLQRDEWDDLDLNIRTWPARFGIWADQHLGVFAWLLLVPLTVGGLLLEWIDFLLIGVRVFARMRPWPKAVYWIAWELAALAFVVAVVASLFTRQPIDDQIGSVAVWLMVGMPVLYFAVRWVLRRALPRRPTKPGSLMRPNP